MVRITVWSEDNYTTRKIFHDGVHEAIADILREEKRLCGTNCNLKWHDAARERIFVVNPSIPLLRAYPSIL